MNEKLRRLAKGKGVALWQVCDAMGISEPTLTRMLRKPLEAKKEREIVAVINRLSIEEEVKRNGNIAIH